MLKLKRVVLLTLLLALRSFWAEPVAGAMPSTGKLRASRGAHSVLPAAKANRAAAKPARPGPQAATTTTIVASQSTITLGDTITFTATVTSGGATPTGIVTFFDGPTPLGSGTLALLEGNDEATFSTSLLYASTSPHSISATYQGDAGSLSSFAAPISITVSPRTSTTGVVLNPTTVPTGQPSTATVTLTDSGSVPPGTAGTFAATGAPLTGRTGFAAALFADGLVLVAGGTDANSEVVNSAEIYSVSGGTFSATGNLNTARTGAAAVLLPNGKMLIAGGSSDGTANGALNSAELFDPTTGTFTATSGNMTAARFGMAVSFLTNGRVLLAGGANSGGVLNSAELYDPNADTFIATGNLNTARTGAGAVSLGFAPAEKVLVVGGSSDGTANGALNTGEVFDPNGNGGVGTFTAIGSTLSAGRWQPEVAYLDFAVEKVLVAGGQNSGGALASADLYDPVGNAFTASTHSMAQARAGGSAVALPNGTALLAGGTTSQAVEFYDFDSDRFDSTGSLQQSDNGLVSILLNNGQVLVVGLTSAVAPASDAELYAPSFNPLGTVAMTSSEATDVLGGACVLVPSTTTASTCTSTVTPANVATSPHTITGTYPADTIHATSNNTASLTVISATTTTLTTNPVGSSVFGQPVTLTATVAPAPGSGPAFGTVSFFNNPVGGPVQIGTAQNVDATGTATLTTPLAVGAYNLTAVYSGNADSATSTSAPIPFTSNKADTTTSVTSSQNPSVTGQTVTFTATVTAVSPGAGIPTGLVTFKANGSTIGSSALNGSGVATLATPNVPPGSQTITTTYPGSNNFNGSAGSLTGNPQVVNPADTTTTVTSSLNPSNFGQLVTFSATVSAVAPGSGLPLGNVSFFDGATLLGTAALGDGPATFSISTLAVGNHPITTTYAGNASFNGSNGTLTGTPQVVLKANTTTTVASSANPSVFGQSVTFTATVTASAAGSSQVPTGAVQFVVDGANLGTPVTLTGATSNSATATSQATTTLTVSGSPHAVTANYVNADGNFNNSNGTLAGSQVVNKANSTTGVTSSLNPSTFGQSVTFTATVAAVGPGAGTPTGTVTFLDNGVAIPAGTSVALTAGVATFATSALTGGNHTITATYSGDASFNTSNGSLTGNPQVVNRANSSTAVTSSTNPSVFGQTVTLTASVSAVAPGTGAPTGTVTFLDNGVAIPAGTGVALTAGIATLATSTLAVGGHTITTTYNGDTNFNTSNGSLTGNPLVITPAASITALTAAPNPSVFGQSVTLTATVTSATTGTPTGTVTFKTNGNAIGAPAALNGSGVATLTTAALAVGAQNLTTVYSGDPNFATSTSNTVSFTVNQGATTTTLTVAPNPATTAQNVTLTATVAANAPASGPPTGTVTFKNGATIVGAPVNLTAGTAVLTTTLPPGALSITAVYSGDVDFLTSTSAVQSVTVTTPTTTTLAGAPNPSTFGQSVTLTATVTPTPTGASLGTVNFFNGATMLGTGNVTAGGTATFTTTTLPTGTLSLTAVYSGNGIFGTSTSTALSFTVNVAPTTTVLTIAPNPGTFGQNITFTATITPAPTGSSLGTVTFLNGATSLGSVAPNSSGVATLTLNTLLAGTFTATASYSGNSNFGPSTSTGVSLTVNTTYAVTAPVTSFLVAQGGSVPITVNVPPQGGPFNNVVTMSATGLPPGATGTFVPPTVTPGAAGATTVLTIQLAPLAAKLVTPETPQSRPKAPIPVFAFAAGLLLFVRRRHLRRSLRLAATLTLFVLVGSTLMGCAGGFLRPPSTPPGAFVVTITGTSGTTVQSTTVTVVVR